MRTFLTAESDLTAGAREAAGELLAAEWGEQWRADAYAGPHAPVLRALAYDDADVLIGNVSAFLIPTDPRLALYGIGDLVVAPRARGRGVACRISTRLVEACRARGAEMLLVDTAAAHRTFVELGFSATEPWAVYYERDSACHRHRHWLSWAHADLPARIQLLAHGDF